MRTEWTCALELDQNRNVVSGSTQALSDAIRGGADLRIYTHFDWLDHMRSTPDQGLVEESIDLRVAYLLDGRWVAALTALRYPANGGLGFGPLPSLSFFMYNQDSQFGIARACFERAPETSVPTDVLSSYRVLDAHDDGTLSPSHNAFYDFKVYRWLVCKRWAEVLSHDENGHVLGGSLEVLIEAFRSGASVKVAIKDACHDLSSDEEPLNHELFVEIGSIYYHRDQGFFSGESQPLVRIAPEIPLRYVGGNWNFGWLLPRTDGVVYHLAVDPYSHAIKETQSRCAMRWFVA